MDLLTAITISMLPGSRSRVSALFKELRHIRDAEPLAALGAFLSIAEPAVQEAQAAAALALKEAALKEIEPIAWFDERFPALLNCIPDPPPVLWVRGDWRVLGRPTVAIVGSRAATTYALQVASRLARELAHRGIIVASGLARGVDSAAHRGALQAAEPTIAVLGSGVDRVYPAEHAELAGNIANTGAVIAELAPGAPPLPEHFPLRNRVISGISLAVVVVEASENSGSLITARTALEQGRDVMAVPGSVLSGRNRGSHSLLKDGAKVVESADDILDELGWPDQARAASDPPRTANPLKTDPLIALMEAGEGYALDELASASGLSASRLLPRLMQLELRGRVAAARGRWTRTE